MTVFEDENKRVIKDKKRDVGISRRRLINPSLINSAAGLSDLELESIAVHIYASVPQLDQAWGSYEEAIPKLRQLVASASIIEISLSQYDVQDFRTKKISKSSARDIISAISNASGLNSLYTRGEHSDLCIFLLSGEVHVVAGRDKFKVTVGPWSVLGQEILIHPDHVGFIPEFSAVVASKSAKYLVLQPGLLKRNDDISPSTSALSGSPSISGGNSTQQETEYKLTRKNSRSLLLKRNPLGKDGASLPKHQDSSRSSASQPPSPGSAFNKTSPHDESPSPAQSLL